MKKYISQTAFFDLLFNLMCCFVVLFSLAFILVNEEKNKEDNEVKSNAEFLITVTWPDKCEDDVDTYVEDSFGNLVFFRRREEGLMHLDRDDLGGSNDTVRGADGITYQVEENQEVVIVRGVIPGEYIVNVHMYRKQSSEETPIHIKAEKVNPKLTLISMSKIILQKDGDEGTAFRFTIDKDGEVTDINHLQKKLAIKGNERGLSR